LTRSIEDLTDLHEQLDREVEGLSFKFPAATIMISKQCGASGSCNKSATDSALLRTLALSDLPLNTAIKSYLASARIVRDSIGARPFGSAFVNGPESKEWKEVLGMIPELLRRHV
jgi:hypothetical protein